METISLIGMLTVNTSSKNEQLSKSFYYYNTIDLGRYLKLLGENNSIVMITEHK